MTLQNFKPNPSFNFNDLPDYFKAEINKWAGKNSTCIYADLDKMGPGKAEFVTAVCVEDGEISIIRLWTVGGGTIFSSVDVTVTV